VFELKAVSKVTLVPVVMLPFIPVISTAEILEELSVLDITPAIAEEVVVDKVFLFKSADDWVAKTSVGEDVVILEVV
jgi:hypothetical protein